MTKNEFIQQINNIERNYKKKFDKEKLNSWWQEFGNIEQNTFTNALKKIINQNKYMPTIAEMKKELEIGRKSISNINLNSSYWYINLRKQCDESKREYYDIRIGQPLAPYKI